MCFNEKPNRKRDLAQTSPGTQAMVASPAKFGRHSQIIVLIGKVSTTLHLALAMHGFVTAHGSLQTPLKHASLLGQSASTWHPASLSRGSETTMRQLNSGIELENHSLMIIYHETILLDHLISPLLFSILYNLVNHFRLIVQTSYTSAEIPRGIPCSYP